MVISEVWLSLQGTVSLHEDQTRLQHQRIHRSPSLLIQLREYFRQITLLARDEDEPCRSEEVAVESAKAGDGDDDGEDGSPDGTEHGLAEVEADSVAVRDDIRR